MVENGRRRTDFAPAELLGERDAWRGYALAVAAVVISVLIRMALTPLVGDTVLLVIIFVPALLISSIWAGAGPSLVATILSLSCFLAFAVRADSVQPPQ